jgi:hypothetical protein
MKDDRRASSLPQHDETGEDGCLIKIDHFGPLVCAGNLKLPSERYTLWPLSGVNPCIETENVETVWFAADYASRRSPLRHWISISWSDTGRA